LFFSTGLITNYFVVKDRKLRRLKNIKIEELQKKKNSLEIELRDLRLKTPTLEKKFSRYAALKEVTEALSSSLSLAEIVDIILERTFSIVDKSEVSVLFLIDEEKQQLTLFGCRNKNAHTHIGIRSKRGDLFDNYVLRYRKPLIVNDTYKDFRFNSDEVASLKYKVRSLISAPLISERKIIGLLRLDSSCEDVYSVDDLRVLDIISNLAATTIRNAQLYLEMEKLAITDSLTGLYVYRYFHQRFSEEIEKSRQGKSPLSLLMLDIDHFKKYNDRYGHSAGDIVLKHIAKLSLSVVTSKDFVARYGGEEFTLVLINTTKDKALLTAEELRKRIEQEAIVLRREKTHVTVSIGVVSLPSDGRGKEELIEKADSALYKAKKKGRNQICTI
jgi:diguanylate cyclase (GGDEF)-like protein